MIDTRPHFLLLIALMLFSCNTSVNKESAGNQAKWQKIDAPDLAMISPDMFDDSELDIPFFLANFHHVANAVVEEGENRGFIDISIWRNQKDNKPYNARIMESILSLAYFYATDRPWNVYYASKQLKVRLEAAMQFWCKIQGDDGRFSEYGDEKWNLAATAFATKFIGETLQLLSKGPSIDADVLQQTIDADRKAIIAVLTIPELWEFGKGFSNQYSNVWAGALAYLNLFPDEQLESLFLQKFDESIEAFQSPAGYFYERNGPDFAYNLGTHENNLMMAYHYTKGTELGDKIIDKSKRFADWLVLNTVPESDSLYFLNRSIETRRNMAVVEPTGPFITQELALANEVPLMRPFLMSREKGQEIIQQKRDSLELLWPKTKALDVGNFWAFTPYDFLHRRVEKWYPSKQEREESLQQFPCMSDNYFIKTLKDTRKEVAYTYINMPGYYAVFNHGEIISKQQRYGLSLLWSKKSGTLWQSQTHNDPACWGTRINDSTLIEAEDLEASIMVDGQRFKEGQIELSANATVKIEYLTERIAKQLLLGPNDIQVTVSGDVKLHEILPLVADGSTNIAMEGNSLQMKKQNGTMEINAGTGRIEEDQLDFIVEGFDIRAVKISASKKLQYTVRFD